MQTVWILEKFVTMDEMNDTLEKLKDMLEELEELNIKDGTVDKIRAAIERQKIHMAECEPEGGHWRGEIGRLNYNHFIQAAKEFMQYEHNMDAQFRVFHTNIINESSRYWLNNYEERDEQDKAVLEYLMESIKSDK